MVKSAIHTMASHRGHNNANHGQTWLAVKKRGTMVNLMPGSNGRSNTEAVGSIPTEVKIIFSLPLVVPWFPLLGLTPSGSFMGFL